MKGNQKVALFTFIEQLKSYKKEYLAGDLIAGLVTAVLLIPQGMAYAMLAGLPPVTGLYASILPLAAYALFGTSRQLSVGPVAIISIVVFTTLGNMKLSPEQYIAASSFLAILVGVFSILMGIFRLGFIDGFLSHSVIRGFTMAAALIIALSQLKHLVGTDPASHHNFFIHLANVGKTLHLFNTPTLIIGVASLVFLLVLKKYGKRIPGGLIVIAVGAYAVQAAGLDRIGIKIVGSIPASLPKFIFPAIDLNLIQNLAGAALVIVLVGFMESISVARAIAARTRQNVDSNREFIGIGAANLAAGLFQAYPVTGGLSRTAVNFEAGARTTLSSLFTACIIAVCILFFTKYLYYIPQASLAALIIVALLNLFEIEAVKQTFKIKKTDGYVMLFTFICTLAIGVEQGILLGIIASLAVFTWKTMHPHIAILGKVKDSDGIYRNVERYEVESIPGTVIIRMDESLYFLNNSCLEKKILQSISSDESVRKIILDAEGINDIDSSGEESLRKITESLRQEGCDLFLCSVKGPVRDTLHTSGFYDYLGEDHFFETIPCCLNQTKDLPENGK